MSPSRPDAGQVLMLVQGHQWLFAESPRFRSECDCGDRIQESLPTQVRQPCEFVNGYMLLLGGLCR